MIRDDRATGGSLPQRTIYLSVEVADDTAHRVLQLREGRFRSRLAGEQMPWPSVTED
jgi:hypothetical protein